ncbi:sulfate respiration complex protein HmcC [Desulfobacula sp.]|uniref:sulfate respiration complex protein HmcC n=1 Tax=Desulfobacula sp. TaxID=2593537 RepID=UPI00261271E2|nr:NrfD/PsrC family molybdoenzyme membrane anchor subunit [Desulfobacula sp.]
MSEQDGVATQENGAMDEKNVFFTPFNVIAGGIVIVGLLLTILRFTKGLGTVTNLSNTQPWGLWIGFDLMCGVALAAGGYTTSAACYLFGMKQYHSAVRPAILTGFLGYATVLVSLLYDVGRPDRLIMAYPFIVQQGTTSLLFEVGLCVMLYLLVLFLEFSPIPLEWLGLRKARTIAVKLTIMLTIFGVVLSTLHQSSLGALFLIAPSKVHPLWYSPYIAVFFFVSSIIAGLSMVIFESSLSHRAFHSNMGKPYLEAHDPLVFGYAKAAALVLFGYFIIKLMGVAAGNHWTLLGTPYGIWFLVEVFGFVALPCLLFTIGFRDKNPGFIKSAAILSIIGIVLNRLNVSIITFNWQKPLSEKYIPSWMEVMLSIFMVTCLVLVFRFIVTRMPVFYDHPDFTNNH